MRYFHLCAHEQFPPSDLLRQAVEAEQAGFDGIGCSDHLQPWWEPGESGHAWVWLGAAGNATQRVALGSAVTPPGPRYHPVLIAQAWATLEEMFPRRPYLGVGSGEALNESPLGAEWPPVGKQIERMEEALDVIPKHVVHPGLLGGWRCRSHQHQGDDRMKIHANAPLGPKGRGTMVRRVLEEGIALTEAAEAAGVSARTARKWVGRYRAEGEAGLMDRSSAPRRVHNTTPPERVEAIAALRRLRMTGPEIAETLEMATSTVSAVLKRIGLGKLSRLDAEEPIRRYERRRAGELIHIDVKKLGRIGSYGAGHRVLGRSWAKKAKTHPDAAGVRRRQSGWDRVHVCVDDATRLAYAEVLPDEKAKTVIGFLRRAVTFYRSHGITVEGLMTDNGPAYCSAAHSLACRAMSIKHIRTRAYRPQTNGKAERFIRTMLREWAYAAVYGSSPERAAALSGWIERYNYRRRHGALGHRPPIQRLRELTGNNVAGIYS